MTRPLTLPTLTRTRSYVGLRNDECDVAASAVELDARRAMCGATCPDTSQALLPELPGADYVQEAYRDRLDEICARHATPRVLHA